MKLSFTKIIILLCGISLLLTGCYKEEYDELKKQISEFQIDDLKTQVGKIQNSVSELETLRSMIVPTVDNLKIARDSLSAELSAALDSLAVISDSNTKNQAKVISLETRIGEISAAIKVLQDANLDKRIEELKKFANSLDTSMDQRLGSLETQAQSFATLEQLAAIQAVVDGLAESFDSNLMEALERNKELIVKWVSESQTLADLFNQYYTKEEIDKIVNDLSAKDNATNEEIIRIDRFLKELDALIPKAIEDAINGVLKHFDDEVEKINNKLNDLSDLYDDLEARITALEKLPAVIGDYSDYKSTIIADILELQRILGSQTEDGSLTALVNTLKLILTDSEGEYYDLADIVDKIASNTDSIADHAGRIAEIEKLLPTLATIESLNSLKDRFDELHNIADNNSANISDLITTVSEIVSTWTDDVLTQINENSADIVELKGKVEMLMLAVGDAEESTGIYGLIADINNKIAELKVPDLWDNVNRINTLLETCGVGGLGLQGSLEDLDARIEAIWDMIGRENLEIGATLINAINLLKAKFGDLGDETVAAILQGLQSDINIIKGEGWAAGIDLTTLNAALLQLQNDLKLKADTLTVNGIKADVASIQETMKTLITSESVNDTLSYYLLSSTASETYATIANLNDFIDSYNTLVGDAITPGTILYRLSVLENIVGDGIFTNNWATDLTAAVNTLHDLVGDFSVTHQADSIAAHIVKDLVETLIGGEASFDTWKLAADSLARRLSVFSAEIAKFRELSVTLGDTSFVYSDINDAVEEVYKQLCKYISQYDDAKGDFSTLADRFIAIETILGNKLVSEDTYYFHAGYTVADAIRNIKELIGMIRGEGDDSTTVAGLIATLQGTYDDLIDALVGGDGGSVEDIPSSLTDLKNRLDTLGFNDVKDKQGNTLFFVLDTLNNSINNIKSIVGPGFSGDTSLTSALRELQDSLKTFSFDSYQSTINGLSGNIQNILNALAGVTGGTIDNVVALRVKVDSVYNALTTLNINGQTTLSGILADLNSRLLSLDKLIGHTKLNKTITEEIADLWTKINDEDYVGQFLNADLFKRVVGMSAIEAKIGNLSSLATSDTSSLVAAINEVYGSIESLKGVSTAQLDSAFNSIVGGSGLTYSTIALLSSAVESIEAAVGTAPAGWDKGTLFEAITALNSSLDNLLGENKTKYTTLWGAIEDLLRQIEEMGGGDDSKGLNELLHSFVFIPEYADGKIALGYTTSKALGTMKINFSVNASDVFFDRIKSGQYKVRAFVNELKTRATKAISEAVDGTIEADAANNKATVRFSGTSLYNVGNIIDFNKSYAVAVQIYDSESGETFTTPYINVLFVSAGDKALKITKSVSGYAAVASPDSTSFKYYTSYNDACVILKVEDILDNGYDVTSSGDWFTVTDNSGNISIKPKDNKEHSGGSVTVKSKAGSESYTFNLSEDTYKFSFGEFEGMTTSGSTVTADNFAANTYSAKWIVTPAVDGFPYPGGYTISDGDGWADVHFNANKDSLLITLAKNESTTAPRSQEVAIMSDNGSEQGVSFTIEQPQMIKYSFALASAEGLIQNVNTLTTSTGDSNTYNITLSSTPSGYAGDLSITKGANTDWITVDSKTDGLSFSVDFAANKTSGNREGTITLSAGDGVSDDLTIKFVQIPKKFTLKLKDVTVDDPDSLSWKDHSKNIIDAWYASEHTYTGKVTLDLDGYDYDKLDLVPGSGISDASISSEGKLTFKLSAAGKDADRDLSLAVYDAENDNVTPLEITIVQKKKQIISYPPSGKIGSRNGSAVFYVTNNFGYSHVTEGKYWDTTDTYKVNSNGSGSVSNSGTTNYTDGGRTLPKLQLKLNFSRDKEYDSWKGTTITITPYDNDVCDSITITVTK